MARVLITGASGLIGRRVVEACGSASTTEVIAVGRADVDLLAAEAWNRLLDAQRPDVVVHLAWSASSLPDYRQHADNWRWAESTIDAAGLAMERGIRFLGTGTSVDTVPADDAYSRSKAETRKSLAPQIEAGELGWLRPFYVFDEELPSPAVLRAALTAKAAGGLVRLTSPDSSHDFIHARDVGTAIRTIVEVGMMGTLDLGSGALVTVAELVESFDAGWVQDGTPGASAASAVVADVTGVRAAGWAPRVTDRRLGRNPG